MTSKRNVPKAQNGRPIDSSHIDALTRKITCSRRFAELIEATLKTGYVPTLPPYPGRGKAAVRFARDVAELADTYDRTMASLGRSERAWRGCSDRCPACAREQR